MANMTIAKMGYCRYKFSNTVPTNWQDPIDVTKNRAINFIIEYSWAGNICSIERMEWTSATTKYYDATTQTEQENEADDPFESEQFQQQDCIHITISGQPENIVTINSNSLINGEATLGNNTIECQSNYFTINFLYEYEDEDNGVQYFIEIKKIKIVKTSKYANNVVFTKAGLNELIDNIKKYPIIGVEAIADTATWSIYTQGKPCIRIDYGDNLRNFIYSSSTGGQSLTTTGSQYIPVGSNINFPNESSTTADGTIQIEVDGTIYYPKVEGVGNLSVAYASSATYATYAIYANGANLNNTTTNALAIYANETGTFDSLAPGTSGTFLQSTGDGITWANALPIGGTTRQFLRGDFAWSDTLEGQLTLSGSSTTSAIEFKMGQYGGTHGYESNKFARFYYSKQAGDDRLYLDQVVFANNTATSENMNFQAAKVYNAVFNDYAEYRTTINLEPGRVVIDNDDGSLSCSSARLQPGAQVISDTFGHCMGETDAAKTPLAVAGRVLVYTYQPRENYHAGMAVCSAPNGTVDIMSRMEICQNPDCIVGIVSEIPQYEIWGTDNVKVNGRIWIKVK